MEKELRRNQISLVTFGTGVILLGVWSVLKTVLYVLAGPPLDLGEETDPTAILVTKIVFFALLGILIAADILLRLYIGRSARAEGLGRPQKSRYLYLTGFIFAINLAGIGYSLYTAFTAGLGDQSRLDFIASCLVDSVSTGLLLRLILAAKRVKKLRRALEG